VGEIGWPAPEGAPGASMDARPGMGERTPQLSVVVPTRNEAGNISALDQRLSEALIGIDYEVLVVDDSNDSLTRPALRATAQRNPAWTVIERSPLHQTGLATAVVTGMAAAQGEAICVMDADLQHPPEVIPALLGEVAQGAGIAIASRYVKGGSRSGLDGTVRNLASRLCTWLAQAIFPEARRTSDPLTGFFCCRRSLVAGLEPRPYGFKILLELLVCAPEARCADVPFAFSSRLSGQSKASTRQGILFLGHLASLFMYIPGSARPLKFAFVTSSGLAVFSALFYTLTHGIAVDPLLAWPIAAGASAGCSLAFHHLFTFRDLASHGEPDGARLHYVMAAVAALGSFTLFAVLLLPGRHALLLAAAAGQGFGVLMMLGVSRPWLWSRLRSRVPLLRRFDLNTLSQELGADIAIWLPADGNFDAEQFQAANGLLPSEMLMTAARSRQPTLVVGRTSPRPQPRVNIETSSALVVPRYESPGHVSAVAVFVRRARKPFQPHHLDRALSFVAATDRWLPASGNGAGR